jgi:recombinational DNA repair protein RecR
MVRRSLTPRQIQLRDALAQHKAEQLVLRQQRLRVVAAKREVDRLCRCDCCGAKTLPFSRDSQLCPVCTAEQREQQRIALLAEHGYGADGRRLSAA